VGEPGGGIKINRSFGGEAEILAPNKNPRRIAPAGVLIFTDEGEG
jgi:hypothetical protein